MRTLKVIIFFWSMQSCFGQTTKLYDSFKTVEDSIIKKINPSNTIIYKTCEGIRVFYLIKKKSQWTGYFIKNIETDLALPTIDTLENGEIIRYKPFLTELSVFNADSLVQLLIKNNIYKVQQISEDSIRTKISYYDKKKKVTTFQSLPYSSHDCNKTIIIYGQNNKEVTYRGALIESIGMHKIPALKIFYLTEEILIKATKNYYR